MKLRDVLRGAAAVAGTVNPAVGAAIGLVNQFLPPEKKLPESATGADIEDAMLTLPPEHRVSLMEREIDLKIAQEEGWSRRYEAMCRADGQSTRPWIAKQMTKVLSFEILAFTLWVFLHPEQATNPALWTVFGTLTAVPATVLINYFGNLRREHGARQASISGVQPLQGVAGLIKSLRS